MVKLVAETYTTSLENCVIEYGYTFKDPNGDDSLCDLVLGSIYTKGLSDAALKRSIEVVESMFDSFKVKADKIAAILSE